MRYLLRLFSFVPRDFVVQFYGDAGKKRERGGAKADYNVGPVDCMVVVATIYRRRATTGRVGNRSNSGRTTRMQLGLRASSGTATKRRLALMLDNQLIPGAVPNEYFAAPVRRVIHPSIVSDTRLCVRPKLKIRYSLV